MHTAVFAGYIGRDAELKSTQSGDAVASFSLGISTGTRDQPKTLWVDCSLWGKRAEALAQHLRKGASVTVSGDVDCRAFTSKKTGEVAAVITCRVDKLTFGSKAEQQREAPAAFAPQQNAYKAAKEGAPRPAAPAPAPAPAAAGFDDDIPF